MARNALYLALGQAATTALAILLTGALGRWLGAADYGTYYVLITMSTSVCMLLEWGQSLWVVRETARAPERAGELLGTALAFRVAIATAATIPVGLLTLALGYGVRTTWLLVLMFLASIPLFLAQAYGIAFRAAERMGRDAAVSVANKVLVLGIALPALAVGVGVPGVILAQALAGGAALFMARALYRRHECPAAQRVSTDRARDGPRRPSRAVHVRGRRGAALSGCRHPLEAGASRGGRLLRCRAKHPGHAARAGRHPGDGLIPSHLARGATRLRAQSTRCRRRCALSSGSGRSVRPARFSFAETAVGLIYGSGFAPAATILKVYAPVLFLVFIDILLGNTLYAAGVALGFAVVLALKVLVSAGLSLVLVPILQARTENGGIGIVLSFGTE